jgi:hypothetical protein
VYESAEAAAVTGSMFFRTGPEDFLKSPVWDDLGNEYQKISIVLPNKGPILYPTNPDFAAPEGSFLWREIGVFATKHHMKLNSFYFSREPTIQNESETKILSSAVNAGNYRLDTLYVFIDSSMWELAKQDLGSAPIFRILDSVPIVTPKGL